MFKETCILGHLNFINTYNFYNFAIRIKRMTRGQRVPLFHNMNYLEKITEKLEHLMQETDCFLVEAKELPTNNFKFFVDADGGFNLKSCVSFSRQLRRFIEDSLWFPEGNFSLEVSSPGIDEPLKMPRQFLKNINRLVKIEFLDKEKGFIEGRLMSVTDDSLVIQTADKKKKITTDHNINKEAIKTTTVQIEF